MKCEELLAMLNDYVDGMVDPAICDEFEKHIAGCNPCQVVVDNIRKTITLYKSRQSRELPLKFRPRRRVVAEARPSRLDLLRHHAPAHQPPENDEESGRRNCHPNSRLMWAGYFFAAA